MHEPVTFERSKKVPGEFGFDDARRGNHTVFTHAETGAILTLPNGDRMIRPIYVQNRSATT